MITIQDPNAVLSVEQVHDLQVRASAYPFDVKVLIDGQAPSKLALENHVASQLTAPRLLVIGIAPTHHFTFVKGSVDLGLPSGPAIASAGNAFFKSGDLVTGIDAIAARALSLRTDSRIVQSQTGVPIVVHEHHTSAGVWWVLGGVAVVILAVAAYLLWRNRRREEEHVEHLAELDLEAATYRGRNLEEQAWSETVAASSSAAPRPLGVPVSSARPVAPPISYVPPPVTVISSAPPPVIVNNPSSGLDNLLAFELGSELGRRDRVVEREVVIERSGSASSWESSDSGSSSSLSDWGSSSDSSSSSSSDWGSSDSGGGSDFGGGDSGGGGSDW